MHPSRAIHGRHSLLLAGRRIIVGVSGSIAAVESIRVIRELIRHGADVRAVVSPEATRIVSEEALAFATGHPPVVRLTGNVEHVTLLGPGEDRADLLLIAPATANTISKIAHGIDDTAVTSCASVALGGGVPLLIAPAMHAHMGQNPAVRENLERLVSWGVGIVASDAAEGEEKLASPETIAAAVLHRLARGPWKGRKVLVIGGASRESIDDVRSITNESSGATAVQLATQAYYRGAEVELWAGSLQVPVPSFVAVRAWRGVAELRSRVSEYSGGLEAADVVLVPAALSDFTIEPRRGKIPSRETDGLRLELRPAPKILPELRSHVSAPHRLVGFKLESGLEPRALEASARRLLEEHRLDWVVANDAKVLAQSQTRLALVSPSGPVQWFSGEKTEVAGRLLDAIGSSLSAPAREARRGGRTSPPSGPRHRRTGPRRPGRRPA
ncbi:MAG: bifunctional phosphopantothenoylcysteine decarboxylase/phosphopantothenate--cysteine ligase CoaBC [Thermoplasmata archaeon]|nr:bifunctional phosphopantothenoylcysteine decarboxylase/phosphopantothenate--cysteine ligase CoaBC [Thermoplasmata archaeon]MCI4362448.1 bifunctional phosphopantothenoylcysteine decarboxylase/phosphopantothenate--cysteine ligase CoaBC [Thermoplasmata archaeon]